MAENGTEQIPQTEEAPAQDQAVEPEQSTEQQINEGSTEEPTEPLEEVRDPILDEEEMRKVFVGGVTTDCTDDELKEFFEQMCCGKVEAVTIIRKDTDKKSHFGFITFETSELVDEVLLKREQLKFKDRQLDVNRAVPKNNTQQGAHDKTKKLFIANLPKFNCTEEDLSKYFEVRHPKKYGVIESIQLIKKKDDAGNKMEENKGYGFIMVSTEDLADKMAIQHSNFEFMGRKIELKKSVPTSEGGSKRGRGRGGGGGHPMYAGGNYGQGGGYGSYTGADYGGWGQYGGQYAGYGYGGYEGYPGAGGYGGGYAAPPQGGRNQRGRGRYTPY